MKAGSVFGSKSIVNFGYDSLKAWQNMAIDEALLNLADRQDRFFLRFYDVQKPSIILSRHDHYSVIREKAVDYDVCRRITGGRPIYLDENTFQYSITGPLHSDDPLSKGTFPGADAVEIHKSFGSILAEVIGELVRPDVNVTLGRSASVRIDGLDGEKLAGHGQFVKPYHSFLYHGVIVVYPWNVERIASLLNMKEEDVQKVAELPCISDYSNHPESGRRFYKDEIRKRLVSKLPDENQCSISALDKRGIIFEAYRDYERGRKRTNPLYDDDPLLRRDVEFCMLFDDKVKQPV